MRGLDKLYLEHEGERLLSRIARHLAPHFSDLVAVSAKPEAFEGLGFRVVPDVIKDSGPLGGLYAGLLAAKSEWVYLLACDMPFFSGPWVDDLQAAINESARSHDSTTEGMAERSENGQILAVAARDGRYHQPFHALYHRSLAITLQKQLSVSNPVSSLQSIVARKSLLLLDSQARLGEEPELFRSINTPEDLADLGVAVTANRNAPGL